MKTTFVTRSVAPPDTAGRPRPPSAITRSARTTWSTISAADRFRVRPAWPVAQNGQFMPHPACDDTHRVMRPLYRISTDSTSAPSKSRHRNLRVSPPSLRSRRTSVMSGGSMACAIGARSASGRSVIASGSQT